MTSRAAVALEALLELLEAGGVTASRDASSFYPDPIGVLVTLPTRLRDTLAASVFEIPIVVVSAEPVNTPEAVDRLYAEADAIAEIVSTPSYRPTTWSGGADVAPLPAIEILATVTAQEEA